MAEYLFDRPEFNDPEAAREHLESIRWPKGPVCPHCGAVDRITKLQGTSHRPGLYDCGHCRDQFTVTVGTLFERSKISLDKWLFAAALMAASKKGVSSKQIERMLGVTYKTAWFITHRLREAMRTGGLSAPFGSGGGNVEVDETYIGTDSSKTKHRGGGSNKNKVLSLVDRATGQSYSMVIDNLDWQSLRPILVENILHEARLLTDEAGHYSRARVYFAGHETVNHKADEYVRLSDRTVHTNTVEGYFSIFKRGMKGVYQHCGKQHLHRYLAEFDFRYNHRIKLGFDDAQRTTALLKGISGKRLMYRPIGSQVH